MAPQLWSTINFNRPEKGAGFFSPPKYLIPRRLIANSQYLRRFAAFCGVLRRFVAFCGVLRQIGDNCERVAAFCGVVQHFAVFCCVLRRFAAFCNVLRCFAAFCGVWRCLTAFCGVSRRVGDEFSLQDQIWGGGANHRPLFWWVENNRVKMGGQWPCFPPP